jgi:DNA-directed RNA polymerase subunit RPC12/RpoP
MLVLYIVEMYNLSKIQKVLTLKVITYMCETCFEPHIFNENVDSDFLCPKCGNKMMYFGTEEIDIETKKVVNRYDDEDRRIKNPGAPIIPSSTPTVTCPYCHSTNVKKITVTQRAVKTGLFGIFGAIDDAGKTYKCENCGCKW